jgi:HEPN domain-containing protein
VTLHCQQAGEKYLKALLEEDELHVPKTHVVEAGKGEGPAK